MGLPIQMGALIRLWPGRSQGSKFCLCSLGEAQMVNGKNVQKSYKILENQLGFLFLHAIESPNLDFM